MQIFTTNECPFAIRGGGHSAIAGAANIDDGVLVSMKRMNSVTINPGNRTITVGAGNTWADIYNAIEPRGFMVVGGRFAPVGLGLALGAGFSYFHNELGLAVDNVAGHRVVLANGSVVETSYESHPDLFWALRGASNNFGIVTHFHLKAIRHRGMYGGRVTYPSHTLEELKKVTYAYQVDTAVNHPDVHVLPSYIYDGVTNETFGNSPITYNQEATDLPDSLRPWLDIEHTESTLRSRTYGDLATEIAAGFPDGLV